MRCRLLLSPIIAVCIAPYGLSQTSPTTVTAWDPNVGDPGSVTRVVSGNLTHFIDPDAAALKGGKLVLMPSPTLFGIHTNGSFDASDMAVGHGWASDGRDVLVYTDGVGLHQLDVETETETTLAGAQWKNARCLATADADGDGVEETVVGVSIDGFGVLVWQAGVTSSFSVAGEITDMCTGSFEGLGGGDSIALASGADLRIMRLNGTAIRTVTGWLPGGKVLRVRDARLARDRVVWATWLSAAEQLLWTLSDDGMDDDPPQSLDNVTLLSWQVGDTDGDGDDDLAACVAATGHPAFVDNHRTDQDPYALSFPMDIAQLTLFDSGYPGPSFLNVAVPALLDLDADEKPDLLQVCQNPLQTDIRTFNGPGPAQQSNGGNVFFVRQAQQVNWDETQSNLSFVIAVPDASENLDKLEMRIYKQSNIDVAAVELVESREVAVENPGDLAKSIVIPETEVVFEAVYNLVFRMVETDSSGATVRAGRPLIVAFCGNPQTMALLEAEHAAQPYFDYPTSPLPKIGGGAGERPHIIINSSGPAGT